MLRSLKVALLSVIALAVMAVPAAASSYPFLSQGARGADVATLQRLLTGQDSPSAITSIFGPSTAQLVRQFQSRNGLVVDGIVGPATWSRLQPTLRQGNRGNAVRALQHALNTKRWAGLAVDGHFGPATNRAVREFQAYMGLTADGIVGPATWRALTGHFVPMPDSGTGFYMYNTRGRWGTGNTVAQMQEVARRWRAEGHPERIGIGHISLQRGGYFAPHRSHQNGVDIDIRIIRKDGREQPVHYWEAAYDRQRTQRLVDMLYATGEVDLILFNDSRIRGATYSAGHDSHMHIRFKR